MSGLMALADPSITAAAAEIKQTVLDNLPAIFSASAVLIGIKVAWRWVRSLVG